MNMIKETQFDRSIKLIGEEGIEALKTKKVAVFGVGGVGGYALEALVRSGVGKIEIIDKDAVDLTNLNRQIIATWNTIGKDKVQVAKERALSINPNIEITAIKEFFLPETSDKFDFESYDYIIDAIDNVTGKIELISKAKEYNVPIISSMGTGNKLRPDMLEIADIHKTSVCPLAKVIRKELKQRGIKNVPVVFSKEEPIKTGTSTPGSMAFVPPVAGMIMASYVIREFLEKN